VHSYLLAESAALLESRLGLEPALRFASSLDHFFVHWIDAEDHSGAVSLLRTRGRRGLSLVDCASFVVMRRYGVTQAIAFDEDFAQEGFEIYSA
jgi:predicted nucleic acid-binding protein